MKIVLLAALLLAPVSAFADMNWDEWLKERTAEYNEAIKKSDEEKIPILGQMLRINTGLNAPPLTDQRLENYKRAQVELLTTKGHAKYYGDRISTTYKDFKNSALKIKIKAGSATDVETEMRYGFRTLSQLPSPETVTVLGEMLSDEWHIDAPPKADYWPSSLAVSAVRPLAKLPFIDPATPPFEDYAAADHLKAWQKWYAEVKAGERSFAFIGQPVSYRFKPDGSVETQPRDASNDPPLFPPTERNERKPSAPPVPQIKEAPSLPWIIGGLITLVIATAVFVLRKKSTRLSGFGIKLLLVAGFLFSLWMGFVWNFLRFHPVVFYGEVPRNHPIYERTGQTGRYPLKYCMVQTNESGLGPRRYAGHFFIARPSDSYWEKTAEIRSRWPWRKATVRIDGDQFVVTATSLLSETNFRSGSMTTDEKLLTEKKYAQIIQLPARSWGVNSNSAVELQKIIQIGLTGEEPPPLWRRLEALYQNLRH